MPSPAAVHAALASFVEPLIGLDLGMAGVLIEVEAGGTRVKLRFGFHLGDYRADLSERLRQHLASVLPDADVELHVESLVTAQAVQKNLQALSGVKNILAVASGKGGVGKSTTAVNLALALQADGARVGILDADVYGPSLPLMLGSAERPTSPDGTRMRPIAAHGLQAMSIGFLMDSTSQPAIWRGPMATQALWQLLNETMWDALDYLVVDLPPGTGDIQLSLSQKIPVAGSVIITTPQDIALLDARKGLEMFRKVGIPVLGVIENMSTHICSNCGHEEAIFGVGGGERLAREAGTELLGTLPLDIRIRQQADSGTPTVIAEPDGALAQRYRVIARLTAARLAYGVAAHSSFPTIATVDD